ncbi:SURP motif repeat profile [Nakaseomyces glabratus]
MTVNDIPQQTKEDINKTVEYLRQYGPEFLEKLRGDVRFEFIEENSPYHSYFISQYQDNNKSHVPDSVLSSNGEVDEEGKEVEEPYEFRFSRYSRSLTKRDFEIIRQDIIPPAIAFPKNNKKNKKHIDLKQIVLDRCFRRAEYAEYTKKLQDVKHKIAHERKIHFAAIKWTEFKVIASMAKLHREPKPAIKFNELIISTIDGKNSALSVFDTATGKELPSLEQREEASTEKKTNKKKMKIRAAGETRLKKRKASEAPSDDHPAEKKGKRMVRCPITNNLIEEDKFDQHIRTILNDPTIYAEEKKKYKQSHSLSNLTSDEVYQNIKRLVKR